MVANDAQYTIRPISSMAHAGMSQPPPDALLERQEDFSLGASHSTSLSPILSPHYNRQGSLSPRTPAQDSGAGGGIFRRRQPSSAQNRRTLLSDLDGVAPPKGVVPPRSDPQVSTIHQKRKSVAGLAGDNGGLVGAFASRARRLRESSVPNLGFLFNNGSASTGQESVNAKRESPRSVSHASQVSGTRSGSKLNSSMRAISFGNLRNAAMFGLNGSKDKSSNLGGISPSLEAKKTLPRLLAPFQIERRKDGSQNSSPDPTEDIVSWMEKAPVEKDPDEVPIRIIRAGNIMLESIPAGDSHASIQVTQTRTLPSELDGSTSANKYPFQPKYTDDAAISTAAWSLPALNEPLQDHSQPTAAPPPNIKQERPGSMPRPYSIGHVPVAHNTSLDTGRSECAPGRPLSLPPSTFQNAPISGALTSTASTGALLSTSSASQALSDLAASLRWTSKFPEGAHMTRARSGALSRRLSGICPMDDAAAERYNSPLAEKELGGGRYDGSLDTDYHAKGDLGRRISGIHTLDYGHSAGSNGPMSGRPVSTASRLSRRLTQRISQRFSSGRRTRYGVPIAETREGLRFLAKSRHEIEAENAGTLYDIGDRNVAFVDPGAGFSSSHVPEGRRAQWNTFKIILVISILTVLIYGLTFLIGILLTWARTWSRADVNVVADTDILIFITLASFLCVFTAVIGLSGVLLNSRPILAIYTFLLWPALISILIVGYTAYKRANLRLDRKLNMAWSRYFDDLSRLRLQNNLHCCGYYSPLHQATFSRRCYPRTSLPGCKGKLYRYEMAALSITYKVTFSIVFVHLINIVCALLCSNHVNLTFGKGLTPRQYRLDMTHVRRNAFNIMKVLTDSAEQRGITLKPESSTQSFTRQLSVADIADGNRPSFEEVPLGRSTPTVPDIDYVATPPAYSHSLDASYDHLASGDPSPSPHHSIRMVGGQGEATGSLGSNVRGLGLSMSVSQNAAALLRERQLAQY